MPILSINLNVTGTIGVKPRIVYIDTNDTLVQVTATGYLNQSVQEGFSFNEDDMALVSTRTTPSSTSIQVGWLEISKSGENWSLVPTNTPGSVVLPTIANHIATYTNTTGRLSEDPATAISGGNIQAGLSGTAGTVSSFPSASASGKLVLSGVANTGDRTVTISNAAHAANATYTIPDAGASNTSFILSRAGAALIQHITDGDFKVSAGDILAGLNVTATGKGFISFPNTINSGIFKFQAVDNSGNFFVTLSNASHGQATIYSIPDAGNALGRVLVGATATPFVSGNFPVSSGVAGKMVDSGVSATDLQNKTNIKAQSTANIGGGGAGPISVVVAGLTASSKIVATIASSSNVVAVGKCIATATGFDITFTGDPGAACVVNYVAFVVAQ